MEIDGQHPQGHVVPPGLLNFDRYLEVLTYSSSYDRLLRCLSQWLALMELSDDLLDRLHLYGHAQYLDMKHARDALREHWQHKPKEVTFA